MNDQDRQKAQAAEEAVREVRSGMVLGLGTGSTTDHAIRFIADRIKSGELSDIIGVPSSLRSEELARSLGIPLTTLDEHPSLDLTIDGADETDPQMNLIKGGGGALLREKILAEASRRLIIIVDKGKLSPVLGTKWAVPVEVLPFALGPARAYLQGLGAETADRTNNDGTPFVTDQGNHIIDARFGPIEDPGGLGSRIRSRAGIIEHGLFVGLAHEIIVAGENGIQHLGNQV